MQCNPHHSREHVAAKISFRDLPHAKGASNAVIHSKLVHASASLHSIWQEQAHQEERQVMKLTML